MAEPVPALYWANLLRPNTPEEAPLSLPKLEGDQEQDTATWKAPPQGCFKDTQRLQTGSAGKPHSLLPRGTPRRLRG